MSILVFGKTGQVATELQRASGVVALGRNQADLSDPEACGKAIQVHKPTAVINAAAYTAVDKAETEEVLAAKINAAAPAAMAKACRELGIPFVQISTDYVFDGNGTKPWTPDASPGPLGAYGRTKLDGERAVQAQNGNYAILRTSWVFSAHGKNFVKTMLRLSKTRDALNVVEDQIGGPTPAADIARACLEIVEQLKSDPQKSGIYHFSGHPDTSWKDFAVEIFTRTKRPMAVTGIPGKDYPTPAPRPLNSRMNCTSLETTFNIPRPVWRNGLQRVLDTLKDQGF